MWLREDGTPYYVGKGRGLRAFRSKAHAVRRPKDSNRIVVFPMNSEKDAFESEIALIELFGRKDLGTGILRNRTDGGEGASNVPVEVRLIRSIAAKKRWADPIFKLKTIALMGNRTLTPEHREKLRLAKLGKKQSPEHVARRTSGNIGKKRTPETKALMSEVHWTKSKQFSDETKRKMSESAKARWAKVAV
jgi:NUMOD3 motif-containing protein